MKTGLSLSLAALAFGASLAGAAEVGVTPTSVMLGESAAFTGAAAQLGIQLNAGIKLWIDQVNESGGVHGRKIQIVTRDDQYEAKACVETTKKLIEEDKVFALIGYVGTPTTGAALPTINAAKIPLVGMFTGAEILRVPFSRYLFHVRASYYDETDAIIQQLLTTGNKRFAVFYQDDAYGMAGFTGTKLAVSKRGGEIVATGTVERNTVNVEKAVKEIVAKQPDAVVMISAYKSIAAFVRAAKKSGYNGGLYNVSFVGSKALAEELGPDGFGVAISQVVPFPWSQKLPVVKEFAALAAKNKVDVNFSSLEGYLIGKVFVEGLKRAGKDLTRDRFIAALETIQNYDFGGFNISYSSTNHAGSQYVDLTIISKNKQFRD
jgi:ABC-type branched-subunit amino acid transport system substrate-binding protein